MSSNRLVSERGRTPTGPVARVAALLCFAAATTAALAGCDKEDGRGPAAGTAPKGAATARGDGAVATGTGVIRGKVKFDGPRPEMKKAEQACHPGGTMPIADESILVGAGGELKNVIVYLTDPPAGADGPAPRADVVVDQKDCVYVPHVVAVRTGQSIKFTSSDAVLHNVHVEPKNNAAMNEGVQKGGEVKLPITAPEFILVKCDVHSWMTCRVGAFDHGYFAVTGDDGSFTFANLPPGTYTVAVKHEKLGVREQQVTVANDKPSEMSFTLAKKQ